VWSSRASEFPAQRSNPSAVWVWANTEAPGNWDRTVEASAGLLPAAAPLDSLFNLSMTFMQGEDGNILLAYGGAEPLEQPLGAEELQRQTRALFDRKSRLAAWTASHCFTASRREEWVQRLRRHATVDVFGKCGGVKGVVAGAGHSRHARRIQRDYFFYLALENRLCKDYITEKLWVDALLQEAIPVVRGGLSDADYVAVAPPGSYVNADWFETPQQLAEHMDEVRRNYTLFASYHAWRGTHGLVVRDVHWATNKLSEEAATCRLCHWLHKREREGPQAPPAMLNLTRFWDPARLCREPTDVPPRGHLLCAGAANPDECRYANSVWAESGGADTEDAD